MKRKADICIIGYPHSVDDKRVFRTVDTLSSKYRVIYVFASRADKNEKEKELKRKYDDVEFVPIPYSSSNGLMRRRNEKRILDICVKSNARIWYFHHPPMTMPFKIFKTGKKEGNMIVCDIHEYYPHASMEYLPSFAIKLKRKIMSHLFKKQLKLVDGLIFISETMGRFILEKYALDKPYTVLPNVADFSLSILNAKKRERRLVLVGKTPRDLQPLYRLEKALKKLDATMSIVVVGIEGGHYNGNVTLLPFMPYSRMMKYLQHSLFSLMTYRTLGLASLNEKFMLPHKFFDTLAAGTPVIVDARLIEMVRWVKKYRVGIVVDVERDPSGSARKIIDTLESEKYTRILETLRNNTNIFVWESYRNRLIEFISSFFR